MLLPAYQYPSIIMFYLLLAASFSMLGVRGATHIVGDGDGWTPFSNYSNWAQGKEFHVGDVLVFNYEEGLHNVMQVNSTAYEDCTKNPNLGLFASGNDTLVLAEVGQTWYICGVGDHCENGQKLSINVIP